MRSASRADYLCGPSWMRPLVALLQIAPDASIGEVRFCHAQIDVLHGLHRKVEGGNLRPRLGAAALRAARPCTMLPWSVRLGNA